MRKAPFVAVVSWIPEDLEKIQGCVEGLKVVISEDRDRLLETFSEAEVAFVGAFDAELLCVAKKLRWVHMGTGGVEGYLFPELVESSVTLTCSKPCFASTGAEHALASMLVFSRQLHVDLRTRPDHSWEWAVPGTLRKSGTWPTELNGKKIGILGMGVMGQEIARIARCFGMRVVGLARRTRVCPPYLDEILGSTELDSLLGSSDFVILSLPLTPETHGFFGAREVNEMKQTAYFIDISGRPALYDLDAITRALKEKRIAGASLQLELPPTDSPLWALDNLLMSFHRVISREEYARCTELFCENLRRYCEGRPLLGLVDKVAGY
jgi:phosphoglycerate dehydrogenase-like enzyme